MGTFVWKGAQILFQLISSYHTVTILLTCYLLYSLYDISFPGKGLAVNDPDCVKVSFYAICSSSGPPSAVCNYYTPEAFNGLHRFCLSKSHRILNRFQQLESFRMEKHSKNTHKNTVKHTKTADIRPIFGEETIENTPLCWKKHITVLKTQQNTVKHTSMRKLSIKA